MNKFQLKINVETEETEQEFRHTLLGIVEDGKKDIELRGGKLKDFNWDLKLINLDEKS